MAIFIWSFRFTLVVNQRIHRSINIFHFLWLPFFPPLNGVQFSMIEYLLILGFGSKKDYTVYLKDYMKKVIKYLEDNNRGEEVETFKNNINKVMKELLGKFKDLQFYTGKTTPPHQCVYMRPSITENMNHSYDKNSEIIGLLKQCLGFGSVGSIRFWVPGSGSAKIGWSPDPRGLISTKNCQKKTSTPIP